MNEGVKMVGNLMSSNIVNIFGPFTIASSVVGIVATGMEMAYMIREAKRNEDRLKM